MSQGERRLAAIMFTDMVGYTSLGQRNEALSLALVEEQRGVVRPVVARHHGREVKTMGDAFLVEFPNVLDAVRCAYDIQRASREFNISMPEDRKINLRIGVHLGDVVKADGDIAGDAVNIASRIEPLAEDGGVCVTREVYNQVANKVDLHMQSLGPKTLKNVAAPVEVYQVVMPWNTQVQGKGEELDTRRIAILPFVSLSPDPNDEYFADGLTEELIDRVCQVRELAVIARTSVMNYKGAKKSASQIGRELRAGALVEGSVRKSSNKIRVTAQLIRADTEEHLWSSKYDRDLADVFAVQSDIAENVAQALKVRLLPSEREAVEKKPTESTEAFALYLKGRYYWNERTTESQQKAAEYFQKAIELDPNFARAYSGLADAYSIMGFLNSIPSAEAATKARALITKALELDGSLAEAYASLGFIGEDGFSVSGSEELYKKAIELNPSYATAHFWYSILLQWLWRFDEAIEHAKRAEELDPLSQSVSVALGQTLAYARRYDEAIAHLQEKIRTDPDMSSPHFMLGIAYFYKGMYEKAEEEERKAMAMLKTPVRPKTILGACLARMGREEEARAILSELKGKAPKQLLAIVCLELGDREAALEYVERAFGERESGLGWISVLPSFDVLRSDPRYVEVLRKMKLPTERVWGRKAP
ncbi:MAG: tetratricopeptide repeat protein [Nitrososphaerota archaeon]|nr:tetratricopeptide repeat protein [Nitrososphaerota archaeon]